MGRGYGYGYGFRPYVPVAQRRAKAQRHAERLAKKGQQLQPIEICGRKIATTFWGKAWCDNLESYSDYANRLPRGRTYVRNGSVVDLQISGGQITAIVSGSEIYEVQIQMTPLSQSQWATIKRDCSQAIDSLMDLLQGRFSKGVMERLTRQRDGLFPQPKEIRMRCSCPDGAVLCKHVAAVLYGVGARLDTDPEMLFRLREVDHLELISQAVDGANLDAALSSDNADSLQGQDLSDLFGIDLDASDTGGTAATKPAGRSGVKRPAARKRSAGKNTRQKNTQAPSEPAHSEPASKASAVTKPVKKAAAKREPSSAVRRSAKKKTVIKKPSPSTRPSTKARPAKKT